MPRAIAWVNTASKGTTRNSPRYARASAIKSQRSSRGSMRLGMATMARSETSEVIVSIIALLFPTASQRYTATAGR
jgi:hypothetical protein